MLLAQVFTSRSPIGPGWLRAFQRPGITTGACVGSWTPPLSPLHHPPPLLAALVGWKDPKRGRCLQRPRGSRSRAGTSSSFLHRFLQLAALRFLGFCGGGLGFLFFFPITIMICQSRVRGRTVKISAKFRAHLCLKERTLFAFCHHHGDCFSSVAVEDFCVPQLKRATQTEYLRKL